MVIRFKSMALAAACLLALPAMPVALAQEHQHEHGTSQPSSASGAKSKAAGGSHDMHRHMMSGMKDMQSMKMTGDPDVDFARMMRMHHQHGIQMAQEELRNGKDEKMRAVAQKIMDGQQKEIRELDDFLKAKGHNPDQK